MTTILPWLGDNAKQTNNGQDLTSLNLQLERLSLDEVLKWAYQKSDNGTKLLPVTSFGPSGLVILHKMKQLGILQKVVSIDTLHLFPETYTYIESWKRTEGSGVQLFVYKPKGFEHKQSFDYVYGIDFYKTNPDYYGYLTKVEPLQRALFENNPKIWITGRRRSQGGERSDMKILEYDQQQRLKLNPLANWSADQVWNYIRQHNIPYNSLHDKGYTSIGDVSTTTQPISGGGERSGRFVGLGKSECGCNKV